MKKFLITLFILLAFGGTIFFLGWAQFSVPPGAYGVVNSKTHGVSSNPVHSGEFCWIWYKLIPTNVKISVFNLERKEFPVFVSSILPSGNSYAAFAGLGADFSWDIKASVSFIIDSEYLTDIIQRKNITDQQGLTDYERSIAQGIELIILRTMTSAEMDHARMEKLLGGGTDALMEQEIANRFPEIRDFSFLISSARFPDFALYRQVRQLYEDFLSTQRVYISDTLGKTAEKHIEFQFRFEELDRYGALLSKYPVLLDYLALEKGIIRKEQ